MKTNTALDLTAVSANLNQTVSATVLMLPLLSPVQAAKLQLAAARDQVKRDRFIKNLKKDWAKQADQITKARKAAEKETEVQNVPQKQTRYTVFGQVWKRNFQSIPMDTLIAIVDAAYVGQNGTLNPTECRQTVQRCVSLLQELGQARLDGEMIFKA